MKLAQAYSRDIKSLIYSELKEAGFRFNKTSIVPPNLNNKNKLRKAHQAAKQHLLNENKEWIIKNEAKLLKYFADGKEIDPEKIDPELVLVDSKDKTGLSDLFRYASYTWSVPLSSGFGRRLRYLVMDKSNNKLIGLIGLTDPVIGLKVRDNFIGWDTHQKEKKLWHVMDIYAFGAVPPYSYLLGGKLVATIANSERIRRDFMKKYGKGRSNITKRNSKSRKGGLLLLTTTGAFGESSILDRLQGPDKSLLWDFVGFTQGWGFFHLNNGIATKIYEYLKQTNNKIVKKHRFGDGPNWKMRLLREGMKELNIDYQKYGKHGIKRGFYVAPLASNFKEVLNEKEKRPKLNNWTTKELFGFFRERYLLPRAQRDTRWKDFSKDEIRVSNKLI
jgi:hypothetical protein